MDKTKPFFNDSIGTNKCFGYDHSGIKIDDTIPLSGFGVIYLFFSGYEYMHQPGNQMFMVSLAIPYVLFASHL